MNFEIGYGFQNVSKVIAYDLNTLVFVQAISYGLKSKNFSYYMLVIWYRIELIFDCHDDLIDAAEATLH